VTTDDTAYGEALNYLVRYAQDDWVMMSVLVSEAREIVRMSATKSDVARTVVSLAELLMERRVVPGDLGTEFVPWTGSKEQRLDRLRAELDGMVERDQLPVGADLCWFTWFGA
jgi:hypothetical protein